MRSRSAGETRHLACVLVRVACVAQKPGGCKEGEGGVHAGIGRERRVMGDIRTTLRALGASAQRPCKVAAFERVLGDRAYAEELERSNISHRERFLARQ